MATKQMCAPKKTAWQTASSTRPVNQVQSSLFVKKLVAMSVSHIVYLRGLLPEEAFLDREMHGVPVKIIFEKSQCAPAQQIVDWLKGAFEAFDQKYLEKLEFIFFVDGPNEPVILESYTFTFTYGDDQVTVEVGAAQQGQAKTQFKLEEIRMATVQLLRHTTMLMQNMNKATENLSMRMRLYYYDEVTPDDYEPPGFERAPDSEYVFEEPNTHLRHGKVDTGFHSMKLSSRIGLSRFREQNEISEDVKYIVDRARRKQAKKTRSQTDLTDCVPSSQPLTSPYTFPEDICNVQSQISNDKESEQMDVPDAPGTRPSQTVPCSFMKETPTDVQNASVHCACGVPEDEGLLVFCEICRRWNHAVCYRFLNEKLVPPYFCCIYCHDSAPNAQCNDSSLIPLSEEDRKMICLYRRALAFCLSTWRVDQRILASELSISVEKANEIIAQMEADKVFSKRKRSKGSYHHINLTHLKDVIIPAYFENAMLKLPSDSNHISYGGGNKSNEIEDPSKGKLRRVNRSTNIIELHPRP